MLLLLDWLVLRRRLARDSAKWMVFGWWWEWQSQGHPNAGDSNFLWSIDFSLECVYLCCSARQPVASRLKVGYKRANDAVGYPYHFPLRAHRSRIISARRPLCGVYVSVEVISVPTTTFMNYESHPSSFHVMKAHFRGIWGLRACRRNQQYKGTGWSGPHCARVWCGPRESRAKRRVQQKGCWKVRRVRCHRK